jgi:hypothetical protein
LKNKEYAKYLGIFYHGIAFDFVSESNPEVLYHHSSELLGGYFIYLMRKLYSEDIWINYIDRSYDVDFSEDMSSVYMKVSDCVGESYGEDFLIEFSDFPDSISSDFFVMKNIGVIKYCHTIEAIIYYVHEYLSEKYKSKESSLSEIFYGRTSGN